MQDLEGGRAQCKEMPSIDLTLAVNYLPAVEVTLKVAFISSCLALLSSTEVFGGFSIMVLMLSIDRSLSNIWILDGNALQFAVLLSWFVNYLRTAAMAPGFVMPMATWLWCVFAFSLVAEPKSVQEFFVLYGSGSGGRIRQIMPALGSSFFVGLFTFLPGPIESGVARIMRSLAFTLLCVLWVYVVNVWRARPRQQAGGMCVFTCHAIIARFCPVLYTQWLVAVLFSVACVVAIAWHYLKLHVVAVAVQPPSVYSPAPPLPEESHTTVMNTIAEGDEEDLEAYFQTAKLQQLKVCD